MQNSLKYQSNIKKILLRFKRFLNISTKDKLLVIRIVYLSLFYRILILIVPFKKISKNLGDTKVISHYKPKKYAAKHLGKVNV